MSAWGVDSSNIVKRIWREAPGSDGDTVEGFTVRIPPTDERARSSDVGATFDGTRAVFGAISDTVRITRAKRRAASGIRHYDRDWYSRVMNWRDQTGGTANAGIDTLVWMTSIFVKAKEGLLDTNVTAEQAELWADFIWDLDNAAVVGRSVTENPVEAWYLRYTTLPSGTDGTTTATATLWNNWWNVNWCMVYLDKYINGLPGVVAASGTVPAYLTITTSNWKRSNWLELARSLES